MKAVSFKVNPKLWEAFLATATHNDTTASQALRAFIRDYIKQGNQDMTNTHKNKSFEDFSAFQGFIEYSDDSGQHWKAEDKGGGVWHVYHQQKNGFIKVGHVRIKGTATPRRIHNALMSVE